MRTITTLTTHQLAVALANNEAREINASEDFPKPDHTVTANDEHVTIVRQRLDDVVRQENNRSNSAAHLDSSALTTGKSAVVQAEYLRKRDAGHYETEVTVTL